MALPESPPQSSSSKLNSASSPLRQSVCHSSSFAFLGPISPSTTDESGYRTHCGSCGSSSHLVHSSNTFFPPGDDEDFLSDDMELEDDVFTTVDEENREVTDTREDLGELRELGDFGDPTGSSSILRPFASVMSFRNRAFSFPFALTDLRFPLASSIIPSVTLRRHFFTGASGDFRIDDDDDDDDDDRNDVDGVDGFDSSSSSSSCSQDDRSSGDDTVRDLDQSPDFLEERYSDLPDLVMSGLHRFPQSPESQSSRSREMEFRIACRLAKIGDEFDLKYFNSSDMTDGSEFSSMFNMAPVTRLWGYLTKKAFTAASLGSGKVTSRQRAHSTAD